MTAKGLRKCRAVHSGENQKPVSHRSPRALGNRCRDSHIPAAPATTAMGKGKSKSRIPTFPQRLPCPCQINQKRKEINPSPKPCPSGSSQDWNVLLISRLITARWINQFRKPVPVRAYRISCGTNYEQFLPVAVSGLRLQSQSFGADTQSSTADGRICFRTLIRPYAM